MSAPANLTPADERQPAPVRSFWRARGVIGLRRPLPLRLWLIVIVVAIIGLGFLTQLMMTSLVGVWRQQAADTQVAAIRQTLGTDTAAWQNPSWRHRAAASLADMQVDVAVFTGQSAQPVFATSGARQLLDTSQQSAASSAAQTTDEANADGPTFQRIALLAAAQDGASARQVGVAFLWFNGPPNDPLWTVLWALTELGAFALALVIVVFLVGQPVIYPLLEMGRAAERIAGGDLDVRLSRSPVHEIAEVSGALEGMTQALRASLARQATLEGERRLFIAAVAHDLRTPLFMLRGYLRGLERGVASSPEKIAHYLAMCQAKADQLERLIADLFAFTRQEYLELEPDRQPMEFGALLREVVEGAQTLAAAKEIRLRLDASDASDSTGAPAHVMGDPHLLARAFENLVDNAIRYTPAGGAVAVRWRTEGQRLIFSVSDTGPGIAPHDLGSLFKPLYRGENSRNRQTGGTGIGLAITQRILEAHGGRIAAANRPAGGAVFTGWLPLPDRTNLPSPSGEGSEGENLER